MTEPGAPPVPAGEPKPAPLVRRAGLRARFLRWLFEIKYGAFRKEQRAPDGRRGLIVLQVDALAYSDLRRALELGYCPTIAHLLDDCDFSIRRWFCGLPSATPYCQAGIFHGENGGIPAFRFYDKHQRQVITCNAPEGVQYIRDRIDAPGALAGGSSYVNLLDGDAQTIAFTVATKERVSVYQRLGGTRMLLLILLHPVRMARMVLQAAGEWIREEWERLGGELARQRTHSEGVFPFIRILSNVVIRELQTMAIVLDVYLGVPVIYSTYMQYDELAHHFGPSSRQALIDLRRTDARIAEIRRMAKSARVREYDLVILSDHGMTPAVSYRVQFQESLGTTVQHMLDAEAERAGAEPLHALASFAENSEYADTGPRAMETLSQMTAEWPRPVHRGFTGIRDWLRRRYGVRDLFVPEKYRVDERHEVVVTYSSCLALVYFADDERQLSRQDIARDPRRLYLYTALLSHPGIGLIATRIEGGVHLESRVGRATIVGGKLEVKAGFNPLETYGAEPSVVRAVHDLVMQPNAGDLVLFGAYDGYEIISFDDQVGAHGSAGGDQVRPFIITPPELDISTAVLEDARDINRVIMSRYARHPADEPDSRDREAQELAEGRPAE